MKYSEFWPAFKEWDKLTAKSYRLLRNLEKLPKSKFIQSLKKSWKIGITIGSEEDELEIYIHQPYTTGGSWQFYVRNENPDPSQAALEICWNDNQSAFQVIQIMATMPKSQDDGDAWSAINQLAQLKLKWIKEHSNEQI